MKKIILAVALVCSAIGFSQSNLSQGVVVAKQSMSSDNEQANMQLAMLGEITTTTYFKGDKSRSETSSPMTGNTIAIMDGAANKMLLMMDNPMMGKKYAINDMHPSEEELKDVSVVKVDETKEVLGYTCTRHDVALMKQGVEVKMILYTTDKLSATSQQIAGLGGKLKGFPLYSEMQMNQMGVEILVKMEVTELKKEAVSDDKFDLTPLEGYEKTEQLGM
ncbi:MAG: hypothetical protein ACPGU9_02145 [Flavobacteriaceae bacterium]